MANDPLIDSLLDASFRGVPFFVTDAGHTTGRRNQRFDFPGLDDPTHEDLGASDGPIQLTCALFGADVLQQVEKLEVAIRAPGPGRLVHPWKGEFDAVIAPGSLADFKWTQSEHYACRFTLTFERTVISKERSSKGLMTPAAADRSYDAGGQWLSGMSNRELISLAGTLVDLAGVLGGLFARRSNGDLASTLASPLARLSRAGNAPNQLPSELPAIGRDFSDRISPQPTAAIGSVNLPQPLSAGQQRGAIDGLVRAAPSTDPGLGLILLGVAAETAPTATYDSRNDALSARDSIVAGLDVIAGVITGRPVPSRPGAAGVRAEAWEANRNLRSATQQDMTERAGTLPPIREWEPRTGTPAMVGLNRLYGDDPDTLFERMRDLMGRNPSVRHPGALSGERLELLDR